MSKFKNFIESVKLGDIETAKLLFESGFFTKDQYGLKPIHWACITCQLDILKWMLENKCDVNLPTQEGWRPIHYAVYMGNRKMVELLIENYCDLDCITDKRKTVLDIATGNLGRKYLDNILKRNNSLRIGLSMGLKCSSECDHKFCLNSVMKCNHIRGRRIGRSIFSLTFVCQDSMSDRKFAVMKIRKNINLEYKEIDLILKNVNRYQIKINHSKIIKYYGMMETPKTLNIYMEWMDKGSLEYEIKSTGALSEDKIARYSKDILQAVAFLHHNKIIHREINPRNILIDNNERCKLIISVFSGILTADRNNEILITIFGRVNYLAPEILNNEQYGYPADIWSVGATVVHMLTGYPPFYRLKSISVILKIGTSRQLPLIISNDLQALIYDMTKSDPSQRVSAKSLLKYNIFKSVPIEYSNNGNNDKSIYDNYIINKDNCIDLIENAFNNKKVGQTIGLKCNDICDHKFCLSSVIATNFKFGEFIDKGEFGLIYKMKDSNSGQELVMKTVMLVDKSDENETKRFENNINDYRDRIKHRNIVKYFGALRNSEQIFIFMEFIDGVNIFLFH